MANTGQPLTTFTDSPVASTEFVQLRSALSKISKGKDVNEDSWMVMWCSTNWGDLLQPAPLSIALLGSLMVTASRTSDFSLITEHTTVMFKYIKYPNSFKTCLQQMVGDGYAAFETASHQMTRINNASSQLPNAIKNVVMLITQNQSPEEIEQLLPIELDAVLELTNICIDASRKCENAFTNISALAQEILECSTNKVGSVEQVTQRNEMHLAILKEQGETERKIVEETKQTSELMKKSFSDAEKDFRTAVGKVPSGWGIMGMQVVENLTSTITTSLNALLGTASVFGQYFLTGLPGIPLAVGNPGRSTQPSGPLLSDPGIALANQVLVFVTSLNLLMSGGSNGKPDWDNIRGTKGKSGGLYVEASLERLKDRLDATKPLSQELLPIIGEAIRIAKSINAIANSIEGNVDSALDEHKPAVKQMTEVLQGIVTRCNLTLQQTGVVATGPGTPLDVPVSSGVTKTAIEIAKFRVDQTRANLEAARDSYDRAATQLIDGQRRITQTIADMTKLSLENATLKDILPVLMQAVKAFTTLRAQFSKMMQLFCNVSSLINDVMKPQVSFWAKKVEASSHLVLAGVTLSDWTKHALYTQMMVPLKVSMLAERISGTYLRVSDLYIMPAQRQVGNMLQFQEDPSEEGKRQFLLKLSQAQATIQEDSQIASEKILELVAEDQQKFVGTINRRLAVIQDTVGSVLPAIKGPVPQQITNVTKVHVEEFDRQREATANALSPYQPNDLM